MTTPDLVILSLLAERPMHGYQVNLELERRLIRDWAAVSRPQIYYSLEKLADSRHDSRRRIRRTLPRAPTAASSKPPPKVATLSRRSRTRRLDHPARPPRISTWVALSWQARPGVFKKQIARRENFLKREIAREKETLDSILAEVGHPYHEAAWMVTLMIEQFQNRTKMAAKNRTRTPEAQSRQTIKIRE